MKSLKEIQVLLKLASSGVLDAMKLAQDIWEYFTKEYNSDYSDESPQVIAKTLHRMNTGSAPRIALVGVTSAGKSSLINALFGQSVAEVRRTPDTTSCVIAVEFPSGLLIYDTPGIGGDEELGYENITRLFLGLPQDEDVKEYSSVPFQEKFSEVVDLSLEKLTQLPSLDAVLLVSDISRTLNKFEKLGLKSLFFELKNKYEGRIVVAGTHLDELNKLTEQERQGQLDSYNRVFDNQLIPVSSVSGEGLPELVVNLFRVMPQKVSPAKLQESLTATRKLNRLQFVITESSSLLAEIIVLKGNQANDIKAAYLWLFALICKQYSVDEDTWLKCNGNALKIGEEAKRAGIKAAKIPRNPKGFWEKLESFFGKRFEKETIEHTKIGVKGLQELLPGIYSLLHEFAEVSSPEITKEAINRKIASKANQLNPLIEFNKAEEIAYQIGEILQELLVISNS